MTKKDLFEKFLQKAIKKFGKKFDYSKVDYVSSITPVIIVCPEHGEFITTPVQFLQSTHGCPKCAKQKVANGQRKTTEEFIKQSKKVWGELYTYEKTEYINADTRVIVTCPLHGDFLARPADFIRHHGCSQCKNNKTKITNKALKLSSKEDFVKKAELLFPGLFSYDKLIYIDSRTKVLVHSILCNEDFYITPAQFLQGNIKNKYLGKIRKNCRKKLTTEAFIQRAQYVHGDKYNYDKTKYVDANTKVIVTCRTHGDFLVMPGDHVTHRQGCPVCNISKGEAFINSVLTDNEVQFLQHYKIIINGEKRYIDFCVILGSKLIFIEYNGRQHYEPVEYFGGTDAFNKQRQRDLDIQQYCIEHKIPLLTYKYDIPFVKLRQLLINDINKYESK